MKRLCDDWLRVFYGDLPCNLPHGHEGNHRGTSRYDSRDVWWTPTDPYPTPSTDRAVNATEGGTK